MLKAIKMLPRAIKNVKRIQSNVCIIELQNSILQKYFYPNSNENIKDKVFELKQSTAGLLESGDEELIDCHIDNFQDWVEHGLVSDLQKLSVLLERRK